MSRSRLVALCGLLTGAAFALSWLEFMLPLSLPVPGHKIGLANIVTLFALYKLGAKPALFILLARCLLSLLLFGAVTQFAFSLAGGLAAYVLMCFLKRSPFFSVYGVSVAGATAHNVGQTTVAALLMGTPELYAYLLYLLPVGILAGLITAYLFKLCEGVRL